MKKTIIIGGAAGILSGAILLGGCHVTSWNDKTASQKSVEYDYTDELERKINEKKIEDCKTEDDKQHEYKRRIKVISEYLPKINSESRKKFLDLKAECEDGLKNILQKQEFDREFDDLKASLGKDSISINEKIDLIQEFVKKYSSLQSKKYFSYKLNDLKANKTQLELDQEWNDIQQKISELCKFNPDGDVSKSDLKEKRQECDDLLEKLSQFNSTNLRKQKTELERQLKEKIEQIDDLLKKVTIEDIEDAERAYKKKPSDENYKVLRKKIDHFDDNAPKNERHKGRYDDIDKNSKQDWETRNEVIRTYKELKANPTAINFDNFNAAINKITAYADTDNLSEYIKIHNYLIKGHTIKVEFCNVMRLWQLESWIGKTRFRLQHLAEAAWTTWLDIKHPNFEFYRGESSYESDKAVDFDKILILSKDIPLKFRIYVIGNWQGADSYEYNNDIFEINSLKLLLDIYDESLIKTYVGKKGVYLTLRITRID